jgi:hypothetical protein
MAAMAPNTPLGDYCVDNLNEPDPHYCRISGTSMSTPHVSGIAALVWSAFPTLTNCQVRAVLRESAAERGAAGFDERYGHGLLDAKVAYDLAAAGSYPDAATCAPVAPSCSVTSPAVGQRFGGQQAITVATSGSADVVGVDLVVDDGHVFTLAPQGDGTFGGTFDVSVVSDATHRILARCADAQGHVGADARSVLFDSVPDPTVDITSPANDALIVGTATVSVHAVSNAGLPLKVEVRINDEGWIDISGTRNNDTYTYNWRAFEDSAVSEVRARATDAGGSTTATIVVRQVLSIHFVSQWRQCWTDLLNGGRCCMESPTGLDVFDRRIFDATSGGSGSQFSCFQ